MGLFGYLLRFLICILTLEFILHFMYMVAIKDTRAWQGDTPAEIGMIGFWNLVIVWLKVRHSLHVQNPPPDFVNLVVSATGTLEILPSLGPCGWH